MYEPGSPKSVRAVPPDEKLQSHVFRPTQLRDDADLAELIDTLRIQAVNIADLYAQINPLKSEVERLRSVNRERERSVK